jgi:hypothetical protein
MNSLPALQNSSNIPKGSSGREMALRQSRSSLREIRNADFFFGWSSASLRRVQIHYYQQALDVVTHTRLSGGKSP